MRGDYSINSCSSQGSICDLVKIASKALWGKKKKKSRDQTQFPFSDYSRKPVSSSLNDWPDLTINLLGFPQKHSACAHEATFTHIFCVFFTAWYMVRASFCGNITPLFYSWFSEQININNASTQSCFMWILPICFCIEEYLWLGLWDPDFFFLDVCGWN